jgi:hypothetical protein
MKRRILLVVFGSFFLHPLAGCEDYDQKRRDEQEWKLARRFAREKEFDAAFKACKDYLTSIDQIDGAKLSELSKPFHDEPKEAVEYLARSDRSLEGDPNTVGTAIYLGAHALAGWDFDQSSRLSNIPNRAKTRIRKGFGSTGFRNRIALFRGRQPRPPAKWLKRMDGAEAYIAQSTH